ncbi:hypothetical protein ACFSTH_02275 [Paenibacillus yanchengensis]|uniref:Uncharacterized protein n=1 Tax=Paenibacillus yanchengensis TaxID=2035833 RepID=A0ABW4YQZ9_9BACL
MEKQFEIKSLSTIMEQLPENSSWRKYYKATDTDDLVAYYDGDLTLSSLNLDWYMHFPEDKGVLCIYVKGNCTIDYIYNQETDGAIALVVEGDLIAKNVVVGGQEIYVVGNMLVEEILCGSYNHGELIVEGNLSTNILISDEEYRYTVNGEKSTNCTIYVWDQLAICDEVPIDMRAVLIDEVFFEEDEDEDEDELAFSFGTLATIVEQGRSAIREEKVAFERKRTDQPYFINDQIDVANLLKLTTCVLMPTEEHFFEIEEAGVYFKVSRAHIDEAGEKRNASIYMMTVNCHYFVMIEDDGIVTILTKAAEEAAEWFDITDQSAEQLADIHNNWIMLLTCVNVAELYLPSIEIKYVEDLLQHPIIQQLDDYGEENDGFWNGSCYYRFRREARMDEDGYCFARRLDIETPDGAFYFYTLDNDGYVSRHYQSPDEAVRQNISYLAIKRWEASERYFARFQQFISKKIDSFSNE